MFATTVDKKTLGEVNSLLISGSSLKETAELSGLDYTKKKRSTRLNRTQRVSTLITETQSPSFDGINLVINGTRLNIRDAKSVDVSTGLVDIKY